MKFVVTNRQTVEAASLSDEPHAYISISTNGCPSPQIRANDKTMAVLCLWFLDLDKDRPGLEAKKFQPHHARAVLDFVFANMKTVETVIVHCDAGLSRSPGVAAALTKIFGGDDSPFFKQCTPNMRVYRMLLEEYVSSLNAGRWDALREKQDA